MAERKSPALAMRPRTLAFIMLIIVVVAAVVVALLLLRAEPRPGRVDLKGLSDSDGVVGFAGMFPPEDAEALRNPLGIAWDGEALYVAESDAGRIAVFDSEGGIVGIIGMVPAAGATVAYPSAIAMADDAKLAVVDNAANRVIVVTSQPAESADALLTLGASGGAPAQPTSVTYSDGEFFVFDAAMPGVRVYDGDGSPVRVLGDALEPPLSYATGMVVAGGRLYVTDSNAGRVVILDPATGAQVGVFEDRYSLPRDVTPLRDGELAVVDTFDRAVFLTDGDGARLASIDAATVPDGLLMSARGAVWLPESERLYVTDATRGRVMVYNVRPLTE